jgi:hypothetical protein
MHRFNCKACSAQIEVPKNYRQPFIKCPECGSHEKIPLASEQTLKFKILTDEQRARRELAPKDTQKHATLSQEINFKETDKKPAFKSHRPQIAPPVIAAKKKASGWPAKPMSYKTTPKPIDSRRILLDALGKQGLEMLFQLVASYLTEVDTNRYRTKRNRVVQRMMKFGLSGEMASRAVIFAEKSPETQKILFSAYKSNLYLGLGVFFTGVLISLMVHLLANPGRGFVLFQIPFAVGFAFAANAGVNMLALKFPALRSDKIHYGLMAFFTIIILGYIVWGFYF